MLLIKSFYNKGGYISPEDELIIYDEVTSLFHFWRYTLIKNSGKKYEELNAVERQDLDSITKHLTDFNFKKDKSIGMQLDKVVVEIIIWGSTVLKEKTILDQIYAKTKKSMFNYFHHELLVDGYLKIGEEKNAIDIIDLIFNKDHIAYLYALLKYDEKKYIKYSSFFKQLVMYKLKVKAKALSIGERVDLENVSFEDLLDLVELVRSL